MAGTKAPGVSDPPQVTEWLPREGSVNLPSLICPCSKINSFVKTSFWESGAILKTFFLWSFLIFGDWIQNIKVQHLVFRRLISNLFNWLDSSEFHPCLAGGEVIYDILNIGWIEWITSSLGFTSAIHSLCLAKKTGGLFVCMFVIYALCLGWGESHLSLNDCKTFCYLPINWAEGNSHPKTLN